MLSRSPTASLIKIVGQRDDAIERLWNVITHRTQWTEYVDTLLDAWYVEGDGLADERTSKNVFDMASEFPFKVCNITIPNSNSGFVYLLVSTVCSVYTLGKRRIWQYAWCGTTQVSSYLSMIWN